MATIILVETNGTLKALKAKEISKETLYKKCGFRISEDFMRRHTWVVKLNHEEFRVSLWAKKNGKANFENKYDFPPPVDKELYFGTCALVRTDAADNFQDLTKEQWEKVYEKLFGGFEDLGTEDEYSEDELEKVDPSLLTAHGYLKDDFVVSDTSPVLSPIPSPPLHGKTTMTRLKKIKKEHTELHLHQQEHNLHVPVPVPEPAASESKPKKTKAKPKPKTETDDKPKKTKTKAAKPEKKEKEIVSADAYDTDQTTSELEEEMYKYSDEE